MRETLELRGFVDVVTPIGTGPPAVDIATAERQPFGCRRHHNLHYLVPFNPDQYERAAAKKNAPRRVNPLRLCMSLHPRRISYSQASAMRGVGPAARTRSSA